MDIQLMKLMEINGHVYILFPTIDITNNQKLESTYYLDLFGWCTSVSLIDFCCLFGSVECFKYLLLNKCEISNLTLKYSIAGGNQDIINILKEKGHSFEECLETSVKYHRYLIEKGANIAKGYDQQTPLHIACS